MANVVALVDPNPERREGFVRAAGPRLHAVPGLVAGGCTAGPFAALWAADPHAPVSAVADDGAAVLLGAAFETASDAPLDVTRLRAGLRSAGARDADPLDGYFAALAYDPHEGLRAGADSLGRFPLYWYAAGDVVLAGSSPELFRLHPSFRAGFDPAGLAGILLTNGLVGARTLWAGVRRLSPGAWLIARPGAPPCEVPDWAPSISDRHFGLPFSRHLELYDAALDAAIRRQVPRAPRPLLLLSGGLDSRTLAGVLGRQGIAPLAITHGQPGDLEVRCATPVARRLGFEHRVSERDRSEFVADAALRIRWEHGTNGFSGAGGWGSWRSLRPLGSRVVSGLCLDWVVGGPSQAYRDFEFDSFFADLNRWGVAPPVLDRLLRREIFGDAVRDLLGEMRARYERYSSHPFQRAWAFALQHRVRFHLSSFSWAESFGAWPIVPATDLGIVALGSGLPLETVDGRRLQVEHLRSHFPQLAALPLDRNSYNTDPLLPSLAYRIRRRVRHELRRFVPARTRGVERRRYYRQFDVNGPGWRAIRRAVEPHRHLGREYFHGDVLDEVLPPADAEVRFADAITGPAGMKTILGFLLWLRDREADGVRLSAPSGPPG